MRAKLVLALLALGLLAPSVAASRDPWTLVDDEAKPIAEARVSLVGRAGSVVTDSEGRFRLDPDPRPPFRLVVFDTAGALMGSVDVEGPVENRTLVLEGAHLESIQVLSGVAPTTLAPPGAATTVVTREEKDRQRPIQLHEMLREIPNGNRSGSGVTAVPTLRGLAGGRTLILIDDARVTTERRAGPSATYLNPFSLERVEIVRGPGGVAYGSDALGGVIHARTPMPDSERRSGRWEVSGGVGMPQLGAAVEWNQPVAPSSALLLQAHGRNLQDYDSPEGTVPNSSAENYGFQLRGSTRSGGGTLATGVQVDRGREIFRPRNDPEVQTVLNPEEDSNRWTISYDHPGWGTVSSLEFRAFVGSYRLTTRRERFATSTDPATVEASDVDANDASLRVVAGTPFEWGGLRWGFDFSSRFDLEARDAMVELSSGGGPTVIRDELTIESAGRVAGGMFLEANWPIRPKGPTLVAGIRGDRVATRNEGGFFGDRRTTNTAPSGHLALTFPFATEWETSVQIARGFRDARLSDRYFQGTTARGMVTGNPDLVPETSRQFDLAVRGPAGPVRLGFFGYYYRIDDLIERFELAPDVFSFRNRGAELTYGLEAEADAALSTTMALRATLGWARGEFADEDDYPDDIPPMRLTVAFQHRPLERVWWRITASANRADDRPGPTERPTPAYTLFHLATGWSFTPRNELRLFVENLFDETFPDSSDSRAPLGPGRSLNLVLAGRF